MKKKKGGKNLGFISISQFFLKIFSKIVVFLMHFNYSILPYIC